MNLVEKLAEIAGEGNVSAQIEDQKTYSVDASQLEGNAQAVVWPISVDQVRQIVRLANVRKFNIVPRGAGTSLEGGTVPNDSVIVDLSKLCRIIALHRGEQYVIVEPGVTVKRLNNVLKNYGLFFPIVPTSFKVCTIGGMVANNSHGTYSYRYGQVSDWVQELEVIDGTGKQLTLKDTKKIIGSEGAFAIIVGIKLKITSLVKVLSSRMITAENAKDLIDKLPELGNDDTIVSLQYFDKSCSKLLDANDETHKLIIEYSAEGKGDAGSKQAVRDMLLQSLHKARYHHIRQVVVPQSNIDSFLKLIRHYKIPVYGNIGNSIFQLFFSSVQARQITEIMDAAKAMQVQPLNLGKINKQYASEQRKPELERLKKIYDPSNLLNQGKVI